jgi:hypothetical protein
MWPLFGSKFSRPWPSRGPMNETTKETKTQKNYKTLKPRKTASA